MFTGIITAIGEVSALTLGNGGKDMHAVIGVPAAFLAAHGGTEIGASIACSGCCLTVVASAPGWFSVDVSAETIGRTNLGKWRPGTRINLERSLRLGDELGGHIVSGHVDGVGRVESTARDQGSLRLSIAVPPPLHRALAAKGSVAVDGVSLTVNEVDGQRFGVNIIPHTASHTTLGDLTPGDDVHIEIDMLARYVARLFETGPQAAPPAPARP